MRRASLALLKQTESSLLNGLRSCDGPASVVHCEHAFQHLARRIIPAPQAASCSLPAARAFQQSAHVQQAVHGKRRPIRAAPRRPRRQPATPLVVPPSHDVQALADAESQPALVLTRNIEMGDLMLGYEQARQLLLKDQTGRPLLALAEQPGSLIAGTLLRQIFDSSRAFTIDVFDVPYLEQYGAAPDQAMFRIKRDFPWFNVMAWLQREILVYDSSDQLVAGVVKVWHPFYRIYDLYHVPADAPAQEEELTMFGRVSTPFWRAIFSWQYPVRGPDDEDLTCIERIFGQGMQGFATQLFTEVGNYWLPFNAHYFDMRRRLAVVACAISIDYDHYSRRAGGGGWLWPGAIIFGGGDD